jgi:hypothetical protein
VRQTAHGLLELLVTSLARMDESVKEEAAGVNHALSVIENLTDVRPAVRPRPRRAVFAARLFSAACAPGLH